MKDEFRTPDKYRNHLSQTVQKQKQNLRDKNIDMFRYFSPSNTMPGKKTIQLSFTGKKYRNPSYKKKNKKDQ
jgi:hypothetical protein